MADFSLLKNTAGLVLLTLLLSPILLLRTASAQVGVEKIPIQPPSRSLLWITQHNPIPPTSGKTTEVVERDGNIYSIDKSGKGILLTSSGVDSEPSLSTDQKWVTFVRENSEIMVEDHAGGLYPAREIWKIATDGSDNPRLVVRHDHSKNGNGLCGAFRKPTFSNDNSEIYFLDRCWVTSNVLRAIDLSNSSIRIVTDANSLDIVRSGRWANHLIVQKHKYFLGSGSYDWYWLVSSDGKTVGPLGKSTKSFKEMWCNP